MPQQFNRFNPFTEYLLKKVMDFTPSTGDTFKVLLTLVAPSSTNGVKADLTEIAAGNGYSAGGVTVTVSGCAQTGGTAKVTLADPLPAAGGTATWQATGGAMADFRYAVLYDDTPAGTPTDPLVGYWDYGAPVSLQVGETFSLDFDGTNGTFTLGPAA